MRFALLLILPSVACGAYCNGSPDPNAPENPLPIVDALPNVVKSVKNGILQLARSDDNQNQFQITHLWGSPYEQGFAHGQLLSDDISTFFQSTYKYLADEVVGSLPNKLGISSWFLELATEKGLDAALDWTYDATVDYVDPTFWDELRGISDGSGTDYDLMRRIHMLPEATKGHCSMFGASGDATKSGNLLQLRALDWDVDGPFKDNVNVIVYHNDDDPDRVSWANVAWSGFIGSVTGFNSQQLAISEIGVTYPDDTFGEESRHGIPFVNLLRDILEKDSHFYDADTRISDAIRTCNLILGVGDAKTGDFNSVQYSNSVANFITPDNFLPANDTWHAPIDDVVYFGMDWLCPNYSEVLHDRLEENWGKIDPEIAVKDIIARTQTGNLHIAVYDLADEAAYLSFAKRSDDDDDETGSMAYERSFTKLDLEDLFKTPPPSSATNVAGSEVARDSTLVDGQWIDVEGNVEALMGTNVVVKGWPWIPSIEETGSSCKDLEDTETVCTSFNSQDIKLMKAQGLNTVRLGVIWAGGQPTEEPELDADFVSRLQAFLTLAHDNDLRVILDLHQDAISSATCGEGVPMWYTKKHLPHLIGKPVVGVESKLTGECSVTDFKGWAEHAGEDNYNVLNKCCTSINAPGAWGEKTVPTIGTQTTFAQLVGTSVGKEAYSTYVGLLAIAVTDYPAAVGIELMNEPPFWGGIKAETNALYDMYKKSYEAIRAVSDNLAVGVADYGEVAKYSDDAHISNALSSWLRNDVTHIFYAFHWYSSGFGDFDEAMSNAVSLSKLWNAAPVLTEWSYNDENAAKLEEYGIHWTFYEWNSYCSVPAGVIKNSTCNSGEDCAFGACIT